MRVPRTLEDVAREAGVSMKTVSRVVNNERSVATDTRSHVLRVIAEKAPGSLDELARITGKAKSNLSRTLRTMEGYGLVRLERGERGRITPKVMHDRVELDLPLTLSRKAS